MHLIGHLPLGGAKASLCRHSASAAASGSSKAAHRGPLRAAESRPALPVPALAVGPRPRRAALPGPMLNALVQLEIRIRYRETTVRLGRIEAVRLGGILHQGDDIRAARRSDLNSGDPNRPLHRRR
jgi:hypothetical protein